MASRIGNHSIFPDGQFVKIIAKHAHDLFEGKELGDSIVKSLRMMRANGQFYLFHYKVLGNNMSDVGGGLHL